jgi:hypothetical protein
MDHLKIKFHWLCLHALEYLTNLLAYESSSAVFPPVGIAIDHIENETNWHHVYCTTLERLLLSITAASIHVMTSKQPSDAF